MNPVAVRARSGYLPGELRLDEAFNVEGQLRYLNRLRHNHADWNYARELARRIDLDLKTPIKNLSKGNKQKVGVVQAFMHKPELLILDEPTAGLDPLVQQTFNALMFEAKAEGRTVFLSSHIISEIERVGDRAGIIREGRLVRVDSVAGLRDLSAHEVELRFPGPVPSAIFEAIEGVSNVSAEGHTLRMLVSGPIAPVVKAAAALELTDFISREPSLEEIFLSEYGREVASSREVVGGRS